MLHREGIEVKADEEDRAEVAKELEWKIFDLSLNSELEACELAV
jgi:hypothetical protein